MTERDLAPILGAWLDEQRRELPSSVRSAVLAAVATAPQRHHRWSRPWTRGVVPGRSGMTAVRLVVAGLAILLLGLVLTRLLAPTVPDVVAPSTEDPPPTLGRDIPDDATSGIIETPLGPARWVRLSGDATTLPPHAPDGARDGVFTARQWEDDPQGVPMEGRMWASKDGIRWSWRPLDEDDPADDPAAIRAGSTWWRFGEEGRTLLGSTRDGGSRSIDLSAAVPSDPPAITWALEPVDVASTGPVTVVQLRAIAIEPFESLGWQHDPSGIRMVEPGLVVIRELDWDTDTTVERRLRFAPTADGLVVTQGTDEVPPADWPIVLTLDGATLDHVRSWVEDGPPVRDVLALVEAGHVVPTFGIGGARAEFQGDFALLGGESGIVAVDLEADRGPARVRRTTDGRTWEDIGTWDVPMAGSGYFDFGSRRSAAGDQLQAMWYPSLSSSGPQDYWRSSDGLHWRPVIEAFPQESNNYEVPAGVIAQQWVEGGTVLWASPDGPDWQPLDLSALGIDERIGASPYFSMGAIGDVLFIFDGDETGRRNLWAISFDVEGSG